MKGQAQGHTKDKQQGRNGILIQSGSLGPALQTHQTTDPLCHTKSPAVASDHRPWSPGEEKVGGRWGGILGR